MGRLLLIACSARKTPDPGRRPAIDRYDGPAFRVLRKYLRDHPDFAPAILILSGRFGLIRSSRAIPDYDQRITPERAVQLRRTVHARLRQAYTRTTELEIGICLGREYLAAVAGLEQAVPPGVRLTVIGGGLGRRLTNLREWLRNPGWPNPITE